MNRIIFILTVFLSINTYSQCDLKLKEKAEEILKKDDATFQSSGNILLESVGGSFKSSCVLKKDITYRIYLIKSDKFDGDGYLTILSSNGDATGSIIPIAGVGSKGGTPYFDIQVNKTSMYHIFVIQNKGAIFCAQFVIALVGKDEAKDNKTLNDVYTMVEEMPQFIDGVSSEESTKQFMNWLAKNLKLTPGLKEAQINGRVYVQFVVNSDGHLSNFKVLRGLNPEADQLVVDLMKTCPAWQRPGKMEGKAVGVWYTLPVSFVNK
jgi:TonB family protein